MNVFSCPSKASRDASLYRIYTASIPGHRTLESSVLVLSPSDLGNLGWGNEGYICMVFQ
jgi:hypothetical protein